MENNAIIKTNDLCKSFEINKIGQKVLKNINLEIYRNDFTVIMGPSGAGKSTLLYALSGMDSPTSGNIIFNDSDITKLNQNDLALFRRKNCGFIFQSVYLINSMNVMDNVLIQGLLKEKDKKKIISKASILLDNVDIKEELRHKFPSQLSGGEAARVGIARALISEPDLIFADEPTGALNSTTGKDVLDTLTEFNRKGQSIVMVTHDINSALRGNRILYIKDGEVAGELELDRYTDSDESRKEKLNSFLVNMGW
ncbi:MAG: ABC transporter ATP-binding protein [Acholeplasmatales bacterium]|jgi:putative ABC transport system ATP-binding protein|nr:ABC transporter ATP-binding protein [Acholeplasmatales bacterium]